MSENPDERLLQHNAGNVKSTKAYRPWERIYLEMVGEGAIEARQREKQLKGGSGREWLKSNFS